MENNGHPLRDGLPVQAPSPDGLGHSAGIPDAEIRDAILMEVAGWVEEGDLIAWQGIGHRRKRVREDAALRIETSEAVRSRLASMIRGRMQNKVGDPIDFLADVKAGRHDRYVTGYILREAIALADKGLLCVTVETQIAGPWNNVVDGQAKYKIAITEKGEEALAKAMEASGQDPTGLDAKHDSAGRQALPETRETEDDQ
jgi:hypothetical protein